MGGRIMANYFLPFTNKFTDMKYFYNKKMYEYTSLKNDVFPSILVKVLK